MSSQIDGLTWFSRPFHTEPGRSFSCFTMNTLESSPEAVVTVSNDEALTATSGTVVKMVDSSFIVKQWMRGPDRKTRLASSQASQTRPL